MSHRKDSRLDAGDALMWLDTVAHVGSVRMHRQRGAGPLGWVCIATVDGKLFEAVSATPALALALLVDAAAEHRRKAGATVVEFPKGGRHG